MKAVHHLSCFALLASSALFAARLYTAPDTRAAAEGGDAPLRYLTAALAASLAAVLLTRPGSLPEKLTPLDICFITFGALLVLFCAVFWEQAGPIIGDGYNFADPH